MLNKLLLVIILCCTQTVFGQSYSYTYQGTLTPSEQEQFELECAKLPHVVSCKMRQKAEKGQGEIIVQLETLERQDQDHPFSTVDLKALLISNGLTPISCTELKANR